MELWNNIPILYMKVATHNRLCVLRSHLLTMTKIGIGELKKKSKLLLDCSIQFEGKWVVNVYCYGISLGCGPNSVFSLWDYNELI